MIRYRPRSLDWVSQAFQRFVRTEALSGVLLLVSAIAALAIANSPWGDYYEHVWDIPIAVGAPGYAFSLTIHEWINDALMAVFFLLVGLEIKRELISGELASPRQAALPIAAAIGGMAVPALLYFSVDHAGPAVRGWAIPMATDIAFAIGALALIAPRLPSGAKVFLTALAIVDDMGAVVVIAFFYTATINSAAMLWTGAALAALVALNVARIDRLPVYLLAGVVLWWYVHASGIHAAIAGVVLALTIPATSRTTTQSSPLLRLEQALHGVSAYLIMPLFAFSNAGVRIGDAPLNWAVVGGIILGLAVGKTIGILAGALGVTSTGLGALPTGVGWRTIVGCASIGGIGLTMSLFIANLAFEGTPLMDSAKVGILGGSLVSAAIGFVILRLQPDRPPGRV
jgi:NhaA family Na+:H+ antiporter